MFKEQSEAEWSCIMQMNEAEFSTEEKTDLHKYSTHILLIDPNRSSVFTL